MSHRALLAAAGAQGKTYVEDVFSAYPFTGNGGTQTITTGIDVATKGGLIWLKSRSAANGHWLVDSQRPVSQGLQTSGNFSEAAIATAITAISSTGFTVGNFTNFINDSGMSSMSWTFRRAPKFFDVVTWTGDGTSNRQIPHALGIAPGMVTAKRRDSTGDWAVWHRSATGDLYLDTTAAQAGSFMQITAASATTFSVSGNANILNATYVAYAWAHDSDTVNGIVQCGSFTTSSGGTATVNLGWEPQYVMIKQVGGVGDWFMGDNARGLPAAPATQNSLSPNTAAAEVNGNYTGNVFSTGFTPANLGNSLTYIYLAIRRGPMRTPTSGASVYNAIARTGTGAAATVTGVGFAPDLFISKLRISGSNGGSGAMFVDRLRGATRQLGAASSLTTETVLSDGVTGFGMDGVSLGADSGRWDTNYQTGTVTFIEWLFARAPGFFDIVCYKGTGANQTLAHNLGVAPKMMWIKDRTATTDWIVYHAALGAGNVIFLNTSGALIAYPVGFNSTPPTAASFTVGTSNSVGVSGDNLVAYLFGEVAGVSSIGSYTGNGVTQTINCGFASGARFVLIKRTDSTGDWLVLDTVRGIVSGSDPYVALDTGVYEVTTADLITPQSVGFGLTSNALVNASGGNFIYFAVS